MPRRRQWSQLSENYRKRLRGAGISKEQYESGAKLKAARGHANTPENASDRRRGLVKKLFEKKRRVWGDRISWNGPDAEKIIKAGSGKKGSEDYVPPLSDSQIEFLLGFDDEEFQEFIDELDFDNEADRRMRAAAFYH